MVKSTPALVSQPEYDLLEAIQAIKYGEIFGVEIKDGYKWIDYELTPAMKDLIEYIREGAQYIDILTIHNGQPVLAETDTKISGFRCRKKVRFPST